MCGPEQSPVIAGQKSGSRKCGVSVRCLRPISSSPVSGQPPVSSATEVGSRRTENCQRDGDSRDEEQCWQVLQGLSGWCWKVDGRDKQRKNKKHKYRGVIAIDR